MGTENFSLDELQQWMQGMLIYHVPVESNFGTNAGAPVEDIVNASQRLSAVSHLDIYRYSYIARLRSCMQSQFSALTYALGNELFQLFADQYLDTYPSESYSLNTLGQHFSSFLEETRPDKEAKESWPDFMIELAGFEYTLSVIFDEYAIDTNTAATIDTPDNMLVLHPVFHLLSHRFPICNYYLEFSQGKEPELPFPEESYCAVIRLNYKLGLFSIRAAQYFFLKRMQETHSFEKAKTMLINEKGIPQTEFDRVWPEWKMNFIASGFFIEQPGT
ncbi:DUF2063 domain-containing protein [Taibaiella lutea]|uniref:DUF2063 domain-containing protein n=1 Tax=Taibaiella lutea TaxID=2608001 RepID=A0A5M6CFW5_9BACT|nr:DNA-binding domain-containing protein [Taibaiella lutea]KAA5532335.1 DUF2063 domain-containing protein [Taibaiella lutea]